MKKVKDMAQTRTKPVWRHFTADKPAKTNVSRQVRVPPRQLTCNTKENVKQPINECLQKNQN
jgi:hypothetical protein